MESELECPVCCCIKRFTPYFICLNGHSICGDCKDQVKDCPECRGLYKMPHPTRNFTIERLIERDPNLELPCKYNKCKFKGVKADREVHERLCPHKGNCRFSPNCSTKNWDSNVHELECGYRPVPCPAGVCLTCVDSCPHGGCKEKLFAKDVMTHLDNDHQRKFKPCQWKDGNFFYCDMTEPGSSGGSDLIKVGSFSLWIRCQKNPVSKLCHIWLTLNASKRDLMKASPMEVVIVGPNNRNILRYDIPIFPLDTSPEEVFQSGKVMGVPEWFQRNNKTHPQVYLIKLNLQSDPYPTKST